MRKSLTTIPVFVPGQAETDIPIDHVSRQMAGKLIAEGRAFSIKGRAIQLLRRQPEKHGNVASLKPDHRIIHRYACARGTETNVELVGAIDKAWRNNRDAQ